MSMTRARISYFPYSNWINSKLYFKKKTSRIWPKKIREVNFNGVKLSHQDHSQNLNVRKFQRGKSDHDHCTGSLYIKISN